MSNVNTEFRIPAQTAESEISDLEALYSAESYVAPRQSEVFKFDDLGTGQARSEVDRILNNGQSPEIVRTPGEQASFDIMNYGLDIDGARRYKMDSEFSLAA